VLYSSRQHVWQKHISETNWPAHRASHDWMFVSDYTATLCLADMKKRTRK
jgi:hypothetical protein